MDQCRLCEEQKELRKSHIIPAFIYKMVRSKELNNRFLELSSAPERKKEYIQQSEIRERLLCENCEQKIGGLEKYAKETLFMKHKVSFAEQDHIDIFKNFEYEKLKLFFLSILWRMSIAKDDMFSDVSLGPHEKRIQEMLLFRKTISTWDYPVFAVYPLFNGSKHEDMILAPSSIKINSHRLYRFVVGGVCVFIATNPKYEENCTTKPLHMTKEQFPLAKIGAERIAFINNWIAEWQTSK